VDSFTDFYSRAIKEDNLLVSRSSDRFRFVDSDLLDLRERDSTLSQAFRHADYIFHLAAQAGVRGSWGSSFEEYVINNVLATQLVLESVRESEAKRLIYASSSSVYGNATSFPLREDYACAPVSPYGATKLMCEHLSAAYESNFGVQSTGLRFFTVFGPRQRPDMSFHKFIRSALLRKPITVYGDGSQTRDFTFVGDIVDAILSAAVSTHVGPVNVGGGCQVPLTEAMGVIEDLTGERLEITYAPVQHGDVRHTAADLTLASSTLGYTPHTGLREGMALEASWIEAGLRDGLL